MSIIKRGAMAMAVVALVGATVPAVVGSNDLGVETSRTIVRGPQQSETPQGALVANPVAAVTPAQVSAMFQQVGADSSLHGDGTYEEPQRRAERIAERSILVCGRWPRYSRRSPVWPRVDSDKRSPLLSIEEVGEQVRGFFAAAGVRIQTPLESAEDRLARIAGQIASGERSLVEVQRTVQGIAAGTVGFDPNGPAQFGGAGVNTDTATIDTSEVSVPSASGAANDPPVPTRLRLLRNVRLLQRLRRLSLRRRLLRRLSLRRRLLRRLSLRRRSRLKPVSGVAVFPGESIQAAVDKHPAGTTFVIKAGVHKRQSVVPKPGNTFVGESGAVLSGEGRDRVCVCGAVARDNVTIRGLVIEKYATPLQKGVVRGGGGSHGWLVEDNEIRYNEGIGVKSGTGWRVVDNLHPSQPAVRAGAVGRIW